MNDDEVAELHDASARAYLTIMGQTPTAELYFRPGCVMFLSGEDSADLNMILVDGPEDAARDFLVTSMERASHRRLPALVQIAPALADVLAADARSHGLSLAGTVPLMVQRSPAEPRAARDCEIVEVRDPEATAEAMGLISAAFSLPQDQVVRSMSASTRTAGCQVYVARTGGAPVSTVTITRDGKTAGVWAMATPPERQGQGWGRALLSRVIDRLRADGVERFYLFASAEGFPLYKSLGFETLAEEAAWVKGHSTQVHA